VVSDLLSKTVEDLTITPMYVIAVVGLIGIVLMGIISYLIITRFLINPLESFSDQIDDFTRGKPIYLKPLAGSPEATSAAKQLNELLKQSMAHSRPKGAEAPPSKHEPGEAGLQAELAAANTEQTPLEAGVEMGAAAVVPAGVATGVAAAVATAAKPEQPVVAADELVKDWGRETTGPAGEPRQPIVEPKQPIVEQKQPIVEQKQPIVEQKQPIVEQRQPIVEPRQPIAEPTQPAYEPKREFKETESEPYTSIELASLLREVFEQHHNNVMSKKLKFSLLVNNEVPLVIRAQKSKLTGELKKAFSGVFEDADFASEVNAQASLLPNVYLTEADDVNICFDFYYNNRHERTVVEAKRDSEH